MDLRIYFVSGMLNLAPRTFFGHLQYTTFWHYSKIPEKAPNPQNQLSRCPKKRMKIPETGLLLTQAVKSEGTNGFSAIELPHVMPVGASQHHKTMPEDAHLPRPSHSSRCSVRPMTVLSVPPRARVCVCLSVCARARVCVWCVCVCWVCVYLFHFV